MSPINRNTLGLRANTRLAGYAALAGAALAAPAVAKATIIYSGSIPFPANFVIPNNFGGVYLNFVTGANSTGSFAGFNWNPYNGGSGLQFFWGGGVNGGLSLDAGATYATLPFGTPITSANTYIALTAAAAAANWEAGANLYLGVQFVNSVTSATNYGWVHLTTTGTTGFPATIVDYAYEDSGGSILAGQVPEPSTFALLGVMAAGALGVREWRKRKAA